MKGKKNKTKCIMKRVVFFMLVMLLVLLCYVIQKNQGILLSSLFQQHDMDKLSKNKQFGELSIQEEYLTKNEYSRPGTKIERITGIVVHYTGNPGTSAEANRNYFQKLAYDHSGYASAHFVVGLEGEIIQCVPLEEQAFATRTRNNDTIGIEVCHPDAAGKYNEKSYKTLIKLAAQLCIKYGLTEQDVIRHYDVTGKICPRYYVEHENEWEKLRKDIGIEIKNLNKKNRSAIQ